MVLRSRVTGTGPGGAGSESEAGQSLFFQDLKARINQRRSKIAMAICGRPSHAPTI